MLFGKMRFSKIDRIIAKLIKELDQLSIAGCENIDNNLLDSLLEVIGKSVFKPMYLMMDAI